MKLTNHDFIGSLEKSRRFFLLHLDGLSPEQLVFKPFPECKNVVETIAHLIIDDRAAVQSLISGKEPDYESLKVGESDFGRLVEMLASSHQELVRHLIHALKDEPLDKEICVWGNIVPAAVGLPHFASEDYYHAGQVAYIRMATDPSWDYYAAVYGGE